MRNDDYYYDHDYYRYRRRRSRHSPSRSYSWDSSRSLSRRRSRSRSRRPSSPAPNLSEEILKSLLQKVAVSSSQPATDTAPPSGFLADLLREYTEEKSDDDPTSDPIDESLAKVLEKWWWTPQDSEDIKKVLKLPKRPSQC